MGFGVQQASTQAEARVTAGVCSFILEQYDCSPMAGFQADYIAAGGNRHPSAADWDAVSGLLAYGTDRNIALWSPLVLKLPFRTIQTHSHHQ